MTMMQKIQAKKSKKGFTLVELVIVIAILAILAAIAIPVITTTINSSKISTMESDCTTIDMVLKDAVNVSKASISTTTYNGNTADVATVADVFTENNLDATTLLDTRTIGGVDYQICWDDNLDSAVISGGAYDPVGAYRDLNGAAVADLSTM